jgi:hypothetical protein
VLPGPETNESPEFGSDRTAETAGQTADDADASG